MNKVASMSLKWCLFDKTEQTERESAIYVCPDSKQRRHRSGPHLARMDFTRARCGPDLGQHYVAVWVAIIRSLYKAYGQKDKRCAERYTILQPIG